MQILIADGKSKPGVVDWISELEDEEIIDEDFTVQVRTVGLEYGTMTSSIANTFSDELDFAAVILQKVPTLRNSIIMQIDITKLFAEAFASFAAESFLAKGGDKGEKGCNITNEKKKARADFYASIDVPFRDWLSQVGVRITTEKEIGDTWWGIVKRSQYFWLRVLSAIHRNQLYSERMGETLLPHTIGFIQDKFSRYFE